MMHIPLSALNELKMALVVSNYTLTLGGFDYVMCQH